MAMLAPLAAPGAAPSQRQSVSVASPTAVPTPSPYGAKADQDSIGAATAAGRHAELDASLAALAAGHAAQTAWNFAVGDDLKVVGDSQQSMGSRVFHGALIAANVIGPEEAGLKAVGKGVFVAAEHAADFAAGKTATSIGRLTVHEGARLNSAEMDVAAKLVHEGKAVEALRPSSVAGVRTADFKVDGVATELKTVSKLTTKDLSQRVKDIICGASGQARNVIIDARKQVGFTENEATSSAARVFGSSYESKLDSVRFIGDGFDQTFR